MTSPQFPDGRFGVLHSSLSQINTPFSFMITTIRCNQGIDICPIHEKVWPSLCYFHLEQDCSGRNSGASHPMMLGGFWMAQ